MGAIGVGEESVPGLATGMDDGLGIGELAQPGNRARRDSQWRAIAFSSGGKDRSGTGGPRVGREEPWRRSSTHHRKPRGRALPPHIRRGNAARSAVRSAIEHVFAHQEGPMALSIRTIGMARAETKIGLVNLTDNIPRLVLHEPRAASA